MLLFKKNKNKNVMKNNDIFSQKHQLTAERRK